MKTQEDYTVNTEENTSEQRFTIVFETSADIESQINRIKEQMRLVGVSEECVNSSTYSRFCDVCKETMPLDYVDGIFGCRLCPLKHDLCITCQKLGEDKDDYDSLDLLECRSMCPGGFGCRSQSRDDLNYPKFDDNNEKTYEAFGKRLSFDRNDVAVVENNENEINTSGTLQIIGHVIYPGIHLDYRCLTDLWLYYRSTESAVIQKYGVLKNPIYSLGIYAIHSLYTNVVPAFNYFLSRKCKSLNFIYPNGHEFIIMKEDLNLYFLENKNHSRYNLSEDVIKKEALDGTETETETQEFICIGVEY